MYKRCLWSMVMVLILSGSAWAQAQPDKSKLPPLPDPFAGQPQYRAGEVIVKYRSNFTAYDRKRFNAQVQASAVNRQQARAAFHLHFRTRPRKQLLLKDWELVRLPEGKTVAEA
ncbi:hypothetical protein JW933_01505, partial [candidate division FCPU426 bacterium]|nr:hypothetical protein [candidate division FCPU426 bacterium]